MAMLGWHYHLTSDSRLPHAQWDSLESAVRGMATDVARYVDGAIERLGLQEVIKSPVIISKAGWGRSSIRKRFEITYTTLIQFIDPRPKKLGKPSKLRMVVITMRSAKDVNNAILEERELDARMATEITEILRRVATDELGGNINAGIEISGSFVDITDDIYKTKIEEAVANGFIAGFREDNTFKPLNILTREQMIAMIIEALTTIPNLSLNPLDDITNNPYPDVEFSRWSASKIAWAKEQNLIQGYPDGTFKPSQGVTRAELIVTLKKVAQYIKTQLNQEVMLEETQAPFDFADISNHWANSVITQMSSFHGVASPLNEKGENFAPNEVVLRNYAATATLRLIKVFQV